MTAIMKTAPAPVSTVSPTPVDALGTAPDAIFEAACKRLFELHANGYKRPRSTTRRPVRPAAHQGDRVGPAPRRTTLL